MNAALHTIQKVLQRPLLVLCVFVLRTAVALGLSWPWVKLLAPGSVMSLPLGDRSLFAPGAALLIRVLVAREQQIYRLARVDAVYVAGLAILGSVFTASVLTTLNAGAGKGLSTWLRSTLRVVPSVVSIAFAFWSVTAVSIALAKFIYPLIPAIVYPIAGEKGADFAILLLVFCALSWVFIVFVISDLARAAAVKFKTGPIRAFRMSIQLVTVRFQANFGVALSWTLPAIIGPALISRCLPSPDSSTKSQMVLVAAMHLFTIMGLCVVHLGWWAAALDLVGSQYCTKNS